MRNVLKYFKFVCILCVCGGWTGSAKAQKAPDTDRLWIYEGTQIAAEGAWCWFADPRALHYENASGTINSSYIGYIDVHGAVKAVQYDFLTRKRSEVLIRSYFQPDDHNNPTFLILPDERVMVFYSRHTDEPCFYYRISTRPGDITSLGEEKKIETQHNTTYPSPFILSDDPEHIYLCWRGINWHPTIAKLSLPDENDEVKVAWGPYQMVQSSGARPYAKYQSDGKSKILLTYTTGHPDNEQPNWLYFNYVNVRTLQLEDAEGKVLSTIADGPLKVNKTSGYAELHPSTVVDRTPAVRDWVWQVVNDEQGRPVIAMVKINDQKTVHDYYYAYWDGNAWKKIFLAHGGGHFHQTPNIERCYSGGMAIDPANPNEVYCSVPINGAFGRVYEIVKYTVDLNGGKVVAKPLTRNSRKNNVRPYILPGSEQSVLRLTWMHGDYYDWILSSQRPGYPTAIYGDFTFPKEPVDLKRALLASSLAEEKDKAASQIKIDKKWQHSDFTLCFNVNQDEPAYGGTWCEGDGWKYGLDTLTMKPYVRWKKETYGSTNVLGTADSWARYGRGTNGKWYPVEKYKTLCVALVYTEGQMTTYINGLIDQVVPMDKCALKEIKWGSWGKGIRHFRLYHRALNQAEIEEISVRGLK